MDFEHVIPALIQRLNDEGIRYGVIGGFAMGLLGAPRSTMDLDFLVHRDDLVMLHGLLSNLGYERLAFTENVSQYVHPTKPGGAIDILHAFRTYSLSMLERATSYPFQDLNITIRVLQPEDIIGLKVQAIANQPARRAQETLDIEALVKRYRGVIDWKRIQQYYDVFDLGEDARQLRARYGATE